jgi:outer membrane autotransporter protein
MIGRGRLRRLLTSLVLAFAWGVSFAPGPAPAQSFLGLDIGVVLKFKAHKDNPQQIPIGTPIALVFIAAGLLFLPVVLNLTGNTLFGDHDTGGALGNAMSCPVFAGTGTILTESGCFWTRVTAQRTYSFETRTDIGSVTLGGQVELAPSWFLGGTIGTGTLALQDDSVGASGYGQTFNGSVALKHTAGPWYFAGALAFASRSLHIARNGGLASSDLNLYGGGLRLRGAYDFAFTDWYVRPRLDLDLFYTAMPGFQESGPAGGTLSVGAVNKTSLALSPAVELGGRYDLDPQTILRPYVVLGFTLNPDSGSTVQVQFTGPQAALGTFQATTSGPGVLGNLEAGLQWYRTKGLELKAEYRLTAGDAYLSQTAGLRGAYRF